LAQAAVWVLGCWVWGASWDADKATVALASVPYPISILITGVFAYIGAHYAGWLAHTTPDPVPVPVPVVDPKPSPQLVHDVGLELLHTEPLSQP
jgi:hypothetical protein